LSTQPHSQLLGLGKAAELQAAKLAKLAQTIIKSAQNKFKHIAIDIAALPVEYHYLFALSLTQAAYGYDEFKSKKNEFVLQQVDLISSQTSLDENQLALVHAVQSGQS
ncbi:leucyl aminopeptidase, partial [Escherichia coli]|nr:leucyl aminopeptidase [Escherichia coli]